MNALDTIIRGSFYKLEGVFVQITDNKIQFLQKPTFMHNGDLAPQS